MIKIWGKHDTMLNNLYVRFKMNLIPDLFEYFREPYFCAIYLDAFMDLQEYMHNVLQLLTVKYILIQKTGIKTHRFSSCLYLIYKKVIVHY